MKELIYFCMYEITKWSLVLHHRQAHQVSKQPQYSPRHHNTYQPLTHFPLPTISPIPFSNNKAPSHHRQTPSQTQPTQWPLVSALISAFLAGTLYSTLPIPDHHISLPIHLHLVVWLMTCFQTMRVICVQILSSIRLTTVIGWMC